MGWCFALRNWIGGKGSAVTGAPRQERRCALHLERLEDRTTPALLASDFAPLVPPPVVAPTPAVLTPADVSGYLNAAAAATASDAAIVAIVDRGGRVLGVRVEGNVSPAILANPATLTFAVDGAIAEARTAAFFSSNAQPLTSRTIEFISQSTITEREVDSDPSIADQTSPLYGPGVVAPIGPGGNFPPDIPQTPSADLFEIELTNRDTTVKDGTTLPSRFNVPLADIPTDVQEDPLAPPDSYGFISGLDPTALPRGIGTLPGGLPIYSPDGELVGGMGVFFPGTTGYASEENSSLSAGYDPSLPDLSEEAEYIAFKAVGPTIPGGLPVVEAGITLPTIGPAGPQGRQNFLAFGATLGTGDPNSNVSAANAPYLPVDPNTKQAYLPVTTAKDAFVGGIPVPDGWLVTPHDSPTGGITAAQVTQIISQGILQAEQTRAQLRLDATTQMVFAVADSQGNVLGLYRMPDATVFSIDVAVAKARNTAYYDNPALLQPVDQVPGIPAGVAFTNRTFRYLAQPYYPEGINGMPPGPFSILNDPGTNPQTGMNTGAPVPASDFTSVQGYDAFHPGTNFHDPINPLNQNGIVFFPGSSAVYTNLNGGPGGSIAGGFGVSGDGVDQDDVVSAGGIVGFTPPPSLTVDHFGYRGVSLPYENFDRNADEV